MCDEAIQNAGFQQSKAYYSLFIRSSGESFTGVVIYVDDMVITGNDSSAIGYLKRFLHDRFQIKDLGKLKYFLGIVVARSKLGISIWQRKYTLDILDDMGLLGAATVTFPMEQNLKLTLTDCNLLHDPSAYRRLFGCLIYLTITRPDISYSVHVLSQFMQVPRKPHFDAAIRVLQYLKATPRQGLLFPAQNDLKLDGFCDVDWQVVRLRENLSLGTVFFLGSHSLLGRLKNKQLYHARRQKRSIELWLRSHVSSPG